MEETQEATKKHRIFSPEQEFEILKDIERWKTIKEGYYSETPDPVFDVPPVKAAAGGRGEGIAEK